jgi:hypothetical protein
MAIAVNSGKRDYVRFTPVGSPEPIDVRAYSLAAEREGDRLARVVLKTFDVGVARNLPRGTEGYLEGVLGRGSDSPVIHPYGLLRVAYRQPSFAMESAETWEIALIPAAC